jgi:hypothetical protein
MRYDVQELTPSLYRLGPPALIWGSLLLFFAIAGAMSHDEPTGLAVVTPEMTSVAPSSVNEADDVPVMFDAPSAPAMRDPATVEHEALDPVGVGLGSTTR